MNKLGTSALAVACAMLWAAEAGATITAQGAVKALTDISQMTSITGTAGFEEGPVGTSANAMTNAAQGLIWYQGDFLNLPIKVSTQGMALYPFFQSVAQAPYFMNCQAGAVQMGQVNYYAGVATFTQTVTQVGLTASTNGTQYMTAWDQAGKMLGQVTWTPGNCTFVGIDTMGVPIGLIAYGNHDLWAGQMYGVGGSTIISDTWVWGPGTPPPPCTKDADCNDKNACNGMETCNLAKGVCNPVAPVDCDDKNVCTADSCDPANGCVHMPTAAGPCDDGSVCTTNDQCNNGMCVGTPIQCDDLNPCTTDACDPMTGCTHMPASGSCDDNNKCTTMDQCTGGTCAGTMVDCDDKNPCTDDACDAATGCTHAFNTATCDDNNKCTTNDTCSGGACTGTPITCDDMNPCTSDTCDPATGTCKHDPVMGCTACVVGGMTLDCDDKDVCTTDACGKTGCTHERVASCCHKDDDCSPVLALRLRRDPRR